MTQKLSEAHLRKLKEGREKFLAQKNGLICKFTDSLAIFADENNFIVKNGTRESYMPSLEIALSDVQEILVRDNILAAEQKQLADVVKAVLDARDLIRNQVAKKLSDNLKAS